MTSESKDGKTVGLTMWRCPKCKASIRIYNVRTVVVTYADGAEAGDLEWGDQNQADCLACDWQGTAGEAYDAQAA
jgi:hypothetical protein